MIVLIMKTGLISTELLQHEISTVSMNLRVEKRKGHTRLQLAQYNC
jgi:hypothetical protein